MKELLRKAQENEDTTPDIRKRMASMMAALTPGERLRMACQMNDTGRILLRAGIKKENPGFTEAQIRGQILLRLYRDDFTNSELRHIASRIPNMQLDLPAADEDDLEGKEYFTT